MHNKKKRYHTLHINMLHKWHAPSTVCFAGEDREVDMEDDIPVWKEESSGTCVLGQDLEDSQWRQLQQMLEDYSDVLTSAPGCTTKTEHTIAVDDSAQPVRRPQYCLPHAYRHTVQKELDEMLKVGIIEPSVSS